MKIDYPITTWPEVKDGDTILAQYKMGNGGTGYYEIKVDNKEQSEGYSDAEVIYLVDRPKPVFPGDYGTIIIAKRVRGTSFPDGVVLARQRGGGHTYSGSGPMWKSLDRKIEGADNHPETQVHDWVLAKVVPA